MSLMSLMEIRVRRRVKRAAYTHTHDAWLVCTCDDVSRVQGDRWLRDARSSKRVGSVCTQYTSHRGLSQDFLGIPTSDGVGSHGRSEHLSPPVTM